MKRTGVEDHSIEELLDDPIGKLLMNSDGVNRCALHLELAQMGRARARMQSEKHCDD